MERKGWEKKLRGKCNCGREREPIGESLSITNENDGERLFWALSGVNGATGACHSEGQHGTISSDDGVADLCQDAEPSCQSKPCALWDDKDGP